MNRILVIARREFAAMVGTKAFLLTLVMMPILMLGGLVLMPLLGKLGGVKERRIVVADASEDGVWLPLIENAADEYNAIIQGMAETGDESPGKKNPFDGAELFRFEAAESEALTDDQRLALSDKIRDGTLYAILEIPATFGAVDELGAPSKDSAAVFSSQDAMMSGARRWLESLLRNQVRQQRLEDLGIDADLVARADVPISVQANSPYKKSATGDVESQRGENMLAGFFLPFGVMMLMFMVIIMAAQPMMESGMEEKQHRIAEILLGSVSPTELMTGKLLGNVAGSFVVFSMYAVGALLVVRYNAWQVDLDYAKLPWLLVFQVLGVLLYSSVFLTIGASVSELKEAQSLLFPAWIVLLSPLMVWFHASRDPNGVVATSLSFFPPSSPLMMALRLSGPQSIPWWHPPLAAVILLLATFAILRVAARIYRVSLLRADSAASFKKMFQRIRTSG